MLIFIDFAEQSLAISDFYPLILIQYSISLSRPEAVLIFKISRCSVLPAFRTVSIKRKLRTGGKMQTDSKM